MAYQDYTAYIEVDTNGHITVTDSDTINCASLSREDDSYVYYDFTADYFDGDFLHALNTQYVSSSDPNPIAIIWGMANVVSNLGAAFVNDDPFLSLRWVDNDLTLDEVTDSAHLYSDTISLSASTRYYVEIQRVETNGTNGYLYAFIYSDSDRTVLVHTLFLALHAKRDFRYLYAMSSWGDNVRANSITADVQNLDLSAAHYVNASYEDFTTFIEVDPGKDVLVVPNMVVASSLNRLDDAYTYKSYGASYFDGDFEHLIDCAAAFGDTYYFWALTNTFANVKTIYDNNGDFLTVAIKNNNHTLYIMEVDGGTFYNDIADIAGITSGTRYYLKLKRDEGTGTHGTFYGYIYDDLAMTNLVDTLSIALHTDKKDYQYVETGMSWYTGLAATNIGDCRNLDLQEASVAAALGPWVNKAWNTQFQSGAWR